MTDRHAIAYRLVANSLRRRGLSASVENVVEVLAHLPLPENERIAIAMAGNEARPGAIEVQQATREWRAKQLAGNPFA
jgi:hypothetical protein